MSNIRTLDDINRLYQPQKLENQSQENQQNRTTADYLRLLFPDFNVKSFTTLNIVICWLLYIISLIIYYAEDKSWFCVLHLLGSHYGPDIGQEYQFHRLITSLFLHGNFQHILLNTLGIAFFGYSQEKYYGIKHFIFIYFCCGIGGNLVSTMWKYQSFSVGASTSLFGIMALMIFYIQERKVELGPKKNIMLAQLGFLIFVNLVSTFQDKNIDIGAHVGGFSYGVLLGFLYYKTITPLYKKIKIFIAAVLVIGSILLVYFIMNHEEKPIFEIYEQYFKCLKSNEQKDKEQEKLQEHQKFPWEKRRHITTNQNNI